MKELKLFNLRCLAVYYAFLVYATLFPFQNWHKPDYAIFNNLLYSWIDKIFFFDIVQNFLLYIPLGFFGFFGLFTIQSTSKHPAWRSLLILFVLLLISLCTSVSLELLQSYNPARVPSLLDVLMNIISGLFGGILAVIFQKPWMSLCAHFKTILYKPIALIGLAFWGIYQLYPFVPTLHPKKLSRGMQPLMDGLQNIHGFNIHTIDIYGLDWQLITYNLSAGVILGLCALLAFKRYAILLLLLFVILVLLGKILIISRTLSLEALAGTVIGVLGVGILFYGVRAVRFLTQLR